LKLQVLKHIQTVFEEEHKGVEEGADSKNRRFFGNISFIGELFLEKFLPVAVVRIVTSSFLNKFICQYQDDNKEGERSYEETLEGLIKFYDIIGKALEEKEASIKKNKKTGDVVANFKEALAKINSAVGVENAAELINDEEISTEKVFKM